MGLSVVGDAAGAVSTVASMCALAAEVLLVPSAGTTSPVVASCEGGSAAAGATQATAGFAEFLLGLGATDQCHHIVEGSSRFVVGMFDGLLLAPVELAGKLSFFYRHGSRQLADWVVEVLRNTMGKDC